MPKKKQNYAVLKLSALSSGQPVHISLIAIDQDGQGLTGCECVLREVFEAKVAVDAEADLGDAPLLASCQASLASEKSTLASLKTVNLIMDQVCRAKKPVLVCEDLSAEIELCRVAGVDVSGFLSGASIGTHLGKVTAKARSAPLEFASKVIRPALKKLMAAELPFEMVAFTWEQGRPQFVKFAEDVEQSQNIASNPQDPYEPKPSSTKPPTLDEYAEWAVELGLDKASFKGLSNKADVHEHIDAWISDLCAATTQLWKELVPKEGVAATLQGELVRAEGRLSGELHRNGMMNWDSSYSDLLHLIGVTLGHAGGFSELVKKGLAADLAIVEQAAKMGEAAARGERPRQDALGGSFFVKSDVESALERLAALIVIWVRQHPAPISYLPGQ